MKNSTLVALTVVAVSTLVAVPAFAGDNGFVVRVPEPGTLALIGAGVGVLAARAWWRNRK